MNNLKDTIIEKSLITQLIKDDLINFKLVFGLTEMGLNAGIYFLHLSEIIFSLIGFSNEERTDELYEYYHELTKRSLQIDISTSHEPLNELAQEIYTALLEKSQQIQQGLAES